MTLTHTSPRIDAPVEEVLPDLFRIEIPLPENPLKATNSYVIRTSKKNLIIDTGLNRKECLAAMRAGLAAIALIGSTRFNTAALLEGLFSGDLPTIIAGLNVFMSTPDFWLWVYLVFAIANAMLPESHDRISWPLLGGVIAGIVAFLLILDLSVLLSFWVEGPLAQLAHWLSLALIIALVTDLLFMALIAGMEWLFSILLNRELEYN